MRSMIPVTAAVVVMLGAVTVPGQEETPQEKVARIQKLLDTPITALSLPESMPLSEFLRTVEGLMPKDAKLPISLDPDAFGKNLDNVAGSPVKFPPFKKMSVHAVLRKALAQGGAGVELDYAIRPTGVVVTRARSAAHEMTYPVGDFLDQVSSLLPLVDNVLAPGPREPRAGDNEELLVDALVRLIDFRPWETVQVVNGKRLVVSASPARHGEVESLLEALRRSADVQVVVNARLYEVDRDFFTENVAPLLAAQKAGEQGPRVVRIDGPLLKKIVGQKLLQESDEEKLRPGEASMFLSRRSAFRYGAEPQRGMVLAGVSFEVKPVVSGDRRFLRLQVTQQSVQVAGVNKVKKLDLATGKGVEVEVPNVEKTSLKGTVTVPDGDPFLMPVEYRPPGKENEDKVWLLVARPIIWIEEEVKEIRKGGGNFTPKSVWETEPSAEEPPPINDPQP